MLFPERSKEVLNVERSEPSERSEQWELLRHVAARSHDTHHSARKNVAIMTK